MQRIERLPEQVIDQIAAGEVVERPASALKELIENSLDAQARHIKVHIQAGGKRLLEVVDDGTGLHPEDMELSLMRGATSKLRSVDDLNSIRSLGFRGEALASIASVSKLTLASRRQEDLQGIQLYAQGGVVAQLDACGMPVGTRVRVEDLFFNVPARRHFLKKEATEAAHIQVLMRTYALSFHDRAFSLTHSGRELWHVSPSNSLRERLIDLWGLEWVRYLVPVGGTAFDLELFGFLGKPEAPPAGRSEQVLWLNGRPIEVSSVRRVLRTTGRQGVPFFLHLKMDPSLVDVNVHPTKREVRFKNPQVVSDFLKKCLEVNASRPWGADPWVEPFRKPRDYVVSEPVIPLGVPSPVVSPKGVEASIRQAVEAIPPVQERQEPAKPSTVRLSPQAPLPDWSFVGSFQKGDYALWESDKGLIIMDVRAGWARVRFEQLQSGQGVAGQALVLSETLHLEPMLFELFLSVEPHVHASGFLTEPFGGNSIKILQVPSWLKGSGADFLRKALVFLQQESVKASDAMGVYLAFAQVAAKKETAHSSQDFYALFQALWSTQEPTHSPWGGATFWVLTPQMLARQLASITRLAEF